MIKKIEPAAIVGTLGAFGARAGTKKEEEEAEEEVKEGLKEGVVGTGDQEEVEVEKKTYLKEVQVLKIAQEVSGVGAVELEEVVTY